MTSVSQVVAVYDCAVAGLGAAFVRDVKSPGGFQAASVVRMYVDLRQALEACRTAELVALGVPYWQARAL